MAVYQLSNFVDAGVTYATAAQALQAAIFASQNATGAWQNAQAVSALALSATTTACNATPFVQATAIAAVKSWGTAVRHESIAQVAAASATAAQATAQTASDAALAIMESVAHGLAADPV